MTTFDPERMVAHRELLRAANFKRVSFFLCDESRRMLAAQRRRGESLSNALNRLLSNTSGCARNESPEDAREFARRVQHARNEILHSLRPSNTNGPYTLAVCVLRPDGSGVRVTPDSIEPFDTLPP
ncbi:hypothetical protein P3T23_006179 [Paraburkholderia sp. GAS448]|uniref:hypothetical protein n=1 Tax=Paraburkholderia sp. GAS448 TaxID=3035136 RepID=UPI003D205F05